VVSECHFAGKRPSLLHGKPHKYTPRSFFGPGIDSWARVRF
jgi:hypothetical protein